MKKAVWISSPITVDGAALDFIRSITLNSDITRAILCVSAIGVYDVHINGKKVGKRVLAPGFTSYKNRVLYQQYDVTDMLLSSNYFSSQRSANSAKSHHTPLLSALS